MKLIEQDEVSAIVECWIQEAYTLKPNDLESFNWKYDGAVILHPDGTKNEKQSTNPYPVFAVWREFL